MLDACYQAKRIRDMLPPLPQGVTPSYLHYLVVMETLEQQGIPVKVSDISDTLHLPRPGVTRTVKEMEAKGYLQKQASPEDGRVLPHHHRRGPGSFRPVQHQIFPGPGPLSGRHFRPGRGHHDPHH